MIINYRYQLVCFFLLLFCIIFTACAAAPSQLPLILEETEQCIAQEDAVAFSEDIPLEMVFHFSGQLTSAEYQLPVEAIEETSYAIHFRGTEYNLYCDSMSSFASATGYHWNILLDAFSPIGKTVDGRLICALADASKSDILLVCPSKTPEYVACYIRKGSSLLDISTYSLSDFSICLNGENILADSPMFEKYWKIHTEIGGISSTYLDGGNRQSYCAVLQCNRLPWLSYTLNYSVFGEDDQYVDIMNIYDVNPENLLHFHPLP